MTRYGLARVSSADQRLSGLGIDAQIERLIAVGIPREHIFVDAGKSGGVHEDELRYKFKDGRYFVIEIDLQPRHEFRRLLGLLKRGDSVVACKWDRISRHNAFLDFFCQYCESAGVALSCLDESNDRLTRRILSCVAEEELLKTVSRNQSIQEAVYARGGWPWKSPLGYSRNSKEKGILRFPQLPDASLVINEAEAAQVRDMFTRMAAGEPYDAICFSHGISHGTLYATIRNRVYRGETHLGDDDWTPTPLIPALVTQAIFDAANANIRSKPKRGERA